MKNIFAIIVSCIFFVSCTTSPQPTQQTTATSARPSKIVFSSDRDGNPEIYTMNHDGSGQTRLTSNQFSDIAPAWSSDGQNIVFLTDRDGNAEVYSMDIFGNNQVNLSNNPAYDIYADWSPDMQKIAFSSNRTGNFEIYVMNADGSNQTQLTNNPEEEGNPRWSPDGTKIAYTSILAGNMEINVMNADGSNQINLTNNPASEGSPTWSPDGEKIAFNSNRDGNWEIYVMNKDGTNQTRLTTNTYNYGYPDWSPEGNFIIFLSDQSGSWDIYVMNADGTNITPLLTGPTNDDSPRWSIGTSTVELSDITNPTDISSVTVIPSTATSMPTALSVPQLPTVASLSSKGGVIVGSSTTEFILYGHRTGTSAEGIQIVDANTLDEVKAQSGVQISLSGKGPQLFAYFPNQQFSSSEGVTALADISVGSTDDPNTSIGFLWTSEIDGTFPSGKVISEQMELFSVQSGQPMELEGWLQLGKVWLADNSGTTDKSQENLDFFLFHNQEDIYVLGFLPDYQSTLPATDLSSSAPTARSGEEYTYLIKGFLGGTLYIPLGNIFPVPVPILQVTSIERKE